MGQLVFQATLGGQVNLVGPNTASTFNLNVPAVAGTLVTTGDTGTVTNTMLASSAYTAPGTIGSGTANTGAFTTLTASSTITGTKLIPTGTSVTGNGMYLPATNSVGISTAGVNAVYIDSAQNVGVGVTPSAWLSTARALDIGSRGSLVDWSSSQQTDIWSNGYFNGTNSIYKTTANASIYRQSVGQHIWYTAPSGTAGTNITFTQAMTLDASGNLGVGTTSPSGKFHTAFNATGNQFAYLTNNQDANTGLSISTSTRTWWMFVGDSASNALRFYDSTAAVERMRIDSSGNLLVGTLTADTYCRFSAQGAVGGRWGFGPSLSGSDLFRVENASATGVYLTNGGTSWTANSDERLKDIIEPITDASNKVSTLRAVIGKYKTDEEGVRRSFLIAQDVQAVLPEAVFEQEDELNTLGVQYTEVIPLLVAAIKEQQALITNLTERLVALEGK